MLENIEFANPKLLWILALVPLVILWYVLRHKKQEASMQFSDKTLTVNSPEVVGNFVYELGVTEIMVVAHTSCGACHMSFGHFREEMRKRGVAESQLHRTDIDLGTWLEGFHDTERSVRDTVTAIVSHPLMPSDVTVRGFIIDSATGLLTEIG